MTELSFVQGSRLRRVFVNGRKISLLSSENSFIPLEINLEKLDEPETKKKLKQSKVDKETIKELSLLNTSEDIEGDIMKDFRQLGWRLIKKQ